MLESPNTRNWFALYTKPRHEFKAVEQLGAANITFYLPTVKVIKKWSDRKKEISEPVLRNYIFIHATELERRIALTLNSIVRTICFDGRPAKIPDWQIENLKLLLSSNPQLIITDGIQVGTQVKICTGPLEGVIGVVKDISHPEKCFSVNIDFLNRSILVSIPRKCLIKIV